MAEDRSDIKLLFGVKGGTGMGNNSSGKLIRDQLTAIVEQIGDDKLKVKVGVDNSESAKKALAGQLKSLLDGAAADGKLSVQVSSISLKPGAVEEFRKQLAGVAGTLGLTTGAQINVSTNGVGDAAAALGKVTGNLHSAGTAAKEASGAMRVLGAASSEAAKGAEAASRKLGGAEQDVAAMAAQANVLGAVLRKVNSITSSMSVGENRLFDNENIGKATGEIEEIIRLSEQAKRLFDAGDAKGLQDINRALSDRVTVLESYVDALRRAEAAGGGARALSVPSVDYEGRAKAVDAMMAKVEASFKSVSAKDFGVDDALLKKYNAVVTAKKEFNATPIDSEDAVKAAERVGELSRAYMEAAAAKKAADASQTGAALFRTLELKREAQKVSQDFQSIKLGDGGIFDPKSIAAIEKAFNAYQQSVVQLGKIPSGNTNALKQQEEQVQALRMQYEALVMAKREAEKQSGDFSARMREAQNVIRSIKSDYDAMASGKGGIDFESSKSGAQGILAAVSRIEGELGRVSDFADLSVLDGLIERLRIAQEEMHGLRSSADDSAKAIGGLSAQKDALSGAMDGLKAWASDAKGYGDQREIGAYYQEEILQVEELDRRYTQWAQKIKAVSDAKRASPDEIASLRAEGDEIEQETAALRRKTEAERKAASASRETSAENLKNSSIYKQITDALNRVRKAQESWTAARGGKSAGAYADLENYAVKLEQLRDKLSGLSPEEARSRLAELNAGFKETAGAIQAAGENTTAFSGRLTSLASKFTSWLTMSQLVMTGVNSVRQMVQSVIELDDAMTQLKVVTQDTDEAYQSYLASISSTAAAIGAKVPDLVASTTTYARLGYSLDESSKLAEFTAMLQNVGDIDVTDAQNAVTAIVKAFGMSVDDIESVMDKLVITGNRFPISVSEIAEGMNNASSALAAAGNTFDQSVALMTAANATIQDAAKSSTGLRTIAARLRNTKTELDDLGESMTVAEYDKMVQSLTDFNVSLSDANGEFKSTYDILASIAAQWDNISTMDQAAIAEMAAGTRQQSVFYSLIEQFQEASGAMDAMAISAGALDQAYGTYMESTTAHLNQFKAAFQGLSGSAIDTSAMNSIIDSGTELLNILGSMAPLLQVIENGVAFFGPAASGGMAAFAVQVSKIRNEVFGASDAIAKALDVVSGGERNIAAVASAMSELSESQKGAVARAAKLSDAERASIDVLLKKTAVVKDITVAEANRILKGNGVIDANKLNCEVTDKLTQKMVLESVANKTLTEDQAANLVVTRSSTVSNEALAASYDKLTVKQKLAAAVGSVSPMGWISIALSLLPLVIRGVTGLYDMLTVTGEEAHEAAQQALQELETTRGELESVNEELETSRQRIDELLKTGEERKLSVVEQEELDNLREEVSLLEQRARFLGYQEEKDRAEANKKVVEDFNKNAGAMRSSDLYEFASGAIRKEMADLELTIGSWTDEQKKRYTELIELNKEYGEAAYRGNYDAISGLRTTEKMDLPAYLDLVISRYKELKKTAEDNAAAGIFDPLVSYEMEGLANRLREIGVSIASSIEDYQGDGMEKEEWQGYLDLIDATVNRTEAFQDKMSQLSESTVSNLNRLASAGDLSADAVKRIVGADILDSLGKLGFTAQDVADYFNALAASEHSAAEAADNAAAAEGRQAVSLSDLKDISADLGKAYDVVEAAQKEMQETGSISSDTLAKLAEYGEDYLDYLYEEDGQLKLNIELWRKRIEAQAAQKVVDLTDEIAQLEADNKALAEKRDAVDTTKDPAQYAAYSAQIRANDKIIDRDRIALAALSAVVKEASDRVGGYSESWKKANKAIQGGAGMDRVAELARENEELERRNQKIRETIALSGQQDANHTNLKYSAELSSLSRELEENTKKLADNRAEMAMWMSDTGSAADAAIGVASAIDKLSEAEGKVDKLRKALAELRDDGRVSAGTLAGLAADFGDLPGFETFVEAVSRSGATMAEAQRAAGELAAQLTQYEEVLAGVTAENAALVESQLKAQGVANAHELVQARLNVAVLETKVSEEGLTGATWDLIEAFLKSVGATEEQIAALRALKLEQYNAALASTNFATASTEVTAALIQQAQAAGVAAEKIDALKRLQSLQEMDPTEAMRQGLIKNPKEYERMLGNLANQAKVSADEINSIFDTRVNLSVAPSVTGGSAGSTKSAQAEAKGWLDILNSLDGGVGNLSSALKELNDEGSISTKTLSGLSGVFGKLSSFNKVAGILGKSGVSMEEAREACNTLAEELIRTSGILDMVTEENAEAIASALEAMGMTNARTLVLRKFNASAAAAIAAENGLTNAAWDQVEAFLRQKGVTEEEIEALRLLRQEQYNAALAAVNFTKANASVTESLIQQARAAGASAGQIEALQKIQKLQAMGKQQAEAQGDLEGTASFEEALNTLAARARFEIGDIEMAAPEVNVNVLVDKEGNASAAAKGMEYSVERLSHTVDRFADATNNLRKATEKIAEIEAAIKTADTPEEKLQKQYELVDAYIAEQDAERALRKEYEGQIADNIKDLTGQGITVKYDQEANTFSVPEQEGGKTLDEYLATDFNYQTAIYRNWEMTGEILESGIHSWNGGMKALNDARKASEPLFQKLEELTGLKYLEDYNLEDLLVKYHGGRGPLGGPSRYELIRERYPEVTTEQQLIDKDAEILDIIGDIEQIFANTMGTDNHFGTHASAMIPGWDIVTGEKLKEPLVADFADQGQYVTDLQNAVTDGIKDTVEDTSSLTSDISELDGSIQDTAVKIHDLRKEMLDTIAEVVTQSNQALDDIQNVYATLKAGAKEFAQTGGYLSLDTYQKILDLGPQYMSFLIDENGQWATNEERIHAVMRAKAEQIAIDNAWAYVQRLDLALQEDAIESLNELLFAEKEASGAKWDLVYSGLALLHLNEEQYEAALHNIQVMRDLAFAAAEGIGIVGDAEEGSISDGKDSISSVIEYVMDLIEQKIQDQVDDIEDMKDAYRELIETKKESLRATREEESYEKNRSKQLKEIAKLQARIDMLSLDSSREAQAEKKRLLEQMSELQESLSDTQSDYAIGNQEDALDKMQDAYEKEKDAEIEELKDSISSKQKLWEKAIDYIKYYWENDWDGLKDELLQWNYEVGSDLEENLVSAWERATEAAERYGGIVEALKPPETGPEEDFSVIGNVGSYPDVPTWQGGTASHREDAIREAVRKMINLGKQWNTGSQSNDSLLAQGEEIYKVVKNNGVTADLTPDGRRIITRDVLHPENVGKLLYDAYGPGSLSTGQDGGTGSKPDQGDGLYDAGVFGQSPYSDPRERAVRAAVENVRREGGFGLQHDWGRYADNLDFILESNGVTARQNEHDGVRYITRDELHPENVGKRLWDCYHTGGIVGGGPLRDDEVLAKLQKGEAVLTRQMWENAVTALERVTRVAELMDKPGLRNGRPDWPLPRGIDAIRPGAVTNINTDERPVEIHFGDTIINGAAADAVERHRAVSREMMNEVARYIRGG